MYPNWKKSKPFWKVAGKLSSVNAKAKVMQSGVSLTKPGRLIVILLLLPVWIIVYMNLGGLADLIAGNIFHFESNKLNEAIRFFLFEVPKVFMLLVLIVFVIGVIRSWVSPEKTRNILEGKPLLLGNVLASLLGIVTPFCSCSAIPLFMGFIEAGIPLGITFSFLIAAPMINEVALVLMAGLFGWRIALIYVLTGVTIAILAGYVIEKLRLQKYVADWIYKTSAKQDLSTENKMNFPDRINMGTEAVKDIMGKIWLFVLIGIAIGAGAHGYVPDDFLAGVLGAQNWFSVPLAITVGIPLYSNAVGIIPIVSVLIEKGVSLGTALAFMMSVIGLSLPEIIILKKVLKWQLIGIFTGIVAFGIIVVGISFNLII